jgi:hypothetical protein
MLWTQIQGEKRNGIYFVRNPVRNCYVLQKQTEYLDIPRDIPQDGSERIVSHTANVTVTFSSNLPFPFPCHNVILLFHSDVKYHVLQA